MKSIDFFIEKQRVWLEAMKNTEYIGDRVVSEADVYDGLRLTPEDAETLGRFFAEAAAVADDNLKEMFVGSAVTENGYTVELSIANAYDDDLNDSVSSALRSFFVATITAKWLRYINQEEADKYASEAQAMMEEVMRLLYSRRRPIHKEIEIIEE